MAGDKIFHNEYGMPFIDVSGEARSLGCLPPDPNFKALPLFESKFDVLPESKWQENSLRDAKAPIRNQRQYGSCTGQGTVTVFTVAKKKNAPSENFDVLSATFIYGYINHGQDQGARVSDAMMSILQNGTCLDRQVPYNMIFKQQFPQEAFETAKRFKAGEAYKLNSWEELCTALTLGIPCASGIAVGRNFVQGQLQSSGIAPLPDSIVGGHCLAHIGLKQINGIWVVETQNSWGTNWGMDGYCYLRKEHWSPGYGFPFDCFAIYSVADDTSDTEDSPPVFAFNEQSKVDRNEGEEVTREDEVHYTEHEGSGEKNYG